MQIGEEWLVLELKILLTGLVVWGITHNLQLAVDRMNRDASDRLWYQVCNALRLLAIAVVAISFLVWVWRHMPTVFRALCSV
jgi:hypothetical protein